MRCPPISTLFPYTTLFRSCQSSGALHHVAGEYIAQHRRLAGADRKSTRLNSSHVAISYAVFCLKKKNTSNVSDIVTSRHVASKGSRPKVLRDVVVPTCITG